MIICSWVMEFESSLHAASGVIYASYAESQACLFCLEAVEHSFMVWISHRSTRRHSNSLGDHFEAFGDFLRCLVIYSPSVHTCNGSSNA